MAFVAAQPDAYLGRVVGSGQCVDFVRAAANVPHTSQWFGGFHVWENVDKIAPGSAIATFDRATGRYTNATDGNSHAAIFMGWDDSGIKVLDQWKLHPVAYRVIRPKGALGGPACDNCDAYWTIEVSA